jgi:ribonuclease BN (tRNA processing enzyme)
VDASERGRRLRLDCLGSAFAFSSGSYWNGWLAGGRVLLDCPPQTLAHLYRLGRTPADLDLVLLSHAHSDHIAGMDLLLLDAVYRHQPEGAPSGGSRETRQGLAVAGPPGIYERLRQIVGLEERRLPPRDDPYITWFEVDGGQAFEWRDLLVEVVAMEHSVPDNGYRVHIDGRVLAYTGDTAPGPHILELARGADALIVECGGPWPGTHCDWPDLFALRRELPASTQVFVTHYDPTSVPPLPEGLDGFVVAEDFGVYEV